MIGIIGGTIAFFTSTISFDNIFGTKPYNVLVTEEFTSPDNWKPGTTTPKKVNIQNKASIEVAVRVKFEGSWVDIDGKQINGNIGNGEEAAILNFAKDYANYWDFNVANLESGWYYYKISLKAGESTHDLLQSVTFNEKASNDYDCTKPNEVNGTTKVTCTSNKKGFDGAKYTLKVTVETIQADQKEEVWGQ